MAGPRFVNAGQVIDPYEGLQRAVSSVGDIYRSYEEDTRRRKEFAAQEAERARIQQSRDAIKNYRIDPANNYAGLDDETKSIVEAQEAAVWERFNKQNPNASEVERKALESRLADSRRQWATSEAVTSQAFNDLIASGVDPAVAAQQAQLLGSGYQSRGAILAQAQAQADAQNARNERIADRALRLFRAEASSIPSGASRTGGSSSKTSGKTVFTQADADKLKETYKGKIGRIDARTAVNEAIRGFNMYNEQARADGRPELTTDQMESVLQEYTTDHVIKPNDKLFKDAADFASILTERFENLSSRGASEQTGPALRLSAQERADILAPRQVVVSPTFNRDRIAAFYASMVPEAQQAPAPAARVAPPAGRQTPPSSNGASSQTPPPLQRPEPVADARSARPKSVDPRQLVRQVGSIPKETLSDAPLEPGEPGFNEQSAIDRLRGVWNQSYVRPANEVRKAIVDMSNKIQTKTRDAIADYKDWAAKENALLAYHKMANDRRLPDSAIPIEILTAALPYLPPEKQAELTQVIRSRQ